MDIFRSIKYAEKAGSGLDKVFTELLSKGKSVPVPQETETSVIFRIEAGMVSDKLVELSLKYQQLTDRQPTVEQLLILNELINRKSCSIKQLQTTKFINLRQIHNALQGLMDLELVEATGSGSGTKYIIHKKHNVSIADKVQYSRLKKQEKARQKEAILRYLDNCDSISNLEARRLLILPDKDISYVSRLFAEMIKNGDIEKIPNFSTSNTRYRRRKHE